VDALRFARLLPGRLLRRVNRTLWLRGHRPLFVPRPGLAVRSSAPRTIQVGVQLHPQHTSYADYRRAWLRADALGVDTIWNWDHFFPLYGNRNGDHLEGWTTLTALGAETRRARVGCLVLSMSYRNAALLSQMAKTLDHITAGRLILGVGAGWFERDYTEYGYEFGTAAQRLRDMERAVEIVKQRWAIDRPAPVNGRIPILIGGGGERVTLRIAARHADLWNGFGPPDRWRAKDQVLDDWCRRVGRDPAEIERSVAIGPGDAYEVDRFLAAGATHFIYGLGAPFDIAPIERLLAWRDRQNASRR
jgi:probable F420-dependent oxidoreductase